MEQFISQTNYKVHNISELSLSASKLPKKNANEDIMHIAMCNAHIN